jgi:hypothetical protein
MRNIFDYLWKKSEPVESTMDNAGNYYLYKMKYDRSLQVNLIKLRRNIKHLAADLRIDKQEYRKWQRAKVKLLDPDDVIFSERYQRCLFLAYAYLRGKRYSEVEDNPHWKRKPFSHSEPNWSRIADIVFQFGNFNPTLLTPHELRQAKQEQADLLRKWAGN